MGRGRRKKKKPFRTRRYTEGIAVVEANGGDEKKHYVEAKTAIDETGTKRETGVQQMRKIDSQEDFDNFVVNEADSMAGQAMWETGALRFSETGNVEVNKEQLQSKVRDYVRASRTSFEGRDFYEGHEDEINTSEAVKAEAMLKLAEAGDVKLTKPQQERLTRAARGEYLDMKYQEVGDRGSFNNEYDRRAAKRGTATDAERRSLREDFNRQFRGNAPVLINGGRRSGASSPFTF